MAGNYLNLNGLNTLWAKIKSVFATKTEMTEMYNGMTAMYNEFKEYVANEFSPKTHAHSIGNIIGEWLTIYNMAEDLTLNSTKYTKLSFVNAVGTSNREFLTNDDGGIKALKSCTVFVFGSVHMGTGWNANDLVHIRVYRNSTATGADFVERKVSTGFGSMDCYTVTNLAAGDYLYIYVQNQTGARGVIRNDTSARITAFVIGV